MADLETRLRQRLDALRMEQEKGRKALEDVETEAANVRATLLRISGAIQVLQEMLEPAGPPTAGGADQGPP